MYIAMVIFLLVVYSIGIAYAIALARIFKKHINGECKQCKNKNS